MTPEQQATLIAETARRIEEDLHFAAPEIWLLHISRRLEEFAADLLDEEGL